MTLQELNDYFNSFLFIKDFADDPSQNGVQVQNAEPKTKQIKKVAFAVDASLETIQKAADQKADVLFVHHGLFWGNSLLITNNHYERIKTLLDNDIALFACHIPLDASKTVGNNIGLAQKLELQNIEDFGSWRGMSIGFKGTLKEPRTTEQICKILLDAGQEPNNVLQFGKANNKTVAIISGGAGHELDQAIEQNVDLYITGEVGHEQFHSAKEAKINVIAGGHYNTETIGVSLVMNKLQNETDIQTVFIDVPTNM